GLGAGRRLSVVTTWFERYIHRCPDGALACFCQGFDFRVRPAKSPVPALADNFTARDDHAADHWIRFDVTLAALRQFQRAEHKAGIIRTERHGPSLCLIPSLAATICFFLRQRRALLLRASTGAIWAEALRRSA